MPIATLKCPYCNSDNDFEYNEEMPGILNGCLMKCEICDDAFSLLPEWLCDGCKEWGECLKYSFVDTIQLLIKEGKLEFDVKNLRRIVK